MAPETATKTASPSKQEAQARAGLTDGSADLRKKHDADQQTKAAARQKDMRALEAAVGVAERKVAAAQQELVAARQAVAVAEAARLYQEAEERAAVSAEVKAAAEQRAEQDAKTVAAKVPTPSSPAPPKA